nr:hypothetical protein [Ilumatobacter nonamiensis]
MIVGVAERFEGVGNAVEAHFPGDERGNVELALGPGRPPRWRPVARRELLFGVTTRVERIDEMGFVNDLNLTIARNYFLQAL